MRWIALLACLFLVGCRSNTQKPATTIEGSWSESSGPSVTLRVTIGGDSG